MNVVGEPNRPPRRCLGLLGLTTASGDGMAGDLSRGNVERYLRVNRRGKGIFVVMAGVTCVSLNIAAHLQSDDTVNVL